MFNSNSQYSRSFRKKEFFENRKMLNPAKEVKQEAKPQKQEDSDDDEPFFSFTTKEEAQEELKTHKLEAGPSRPTRDMIRWVFNL